MKNIGIVSILFGLLFLVGCDDDEYADYSAPDQLSDVSWYMSVDPYSQDKYSISSNTFISFLDLSQGAVSHEWIIEEGNSFLKEGFNKNDSLELFTDEAAGLIIDKGKAHVLFRNSGFNKVRLVNKFTEKVSYNSEESPLEAFQEGDLWVIDTIFTFDVYGKLMPSFKIMQGDTEIINITKDDLPSIDDAASWPTVEVEAGSFLTYVDLTTEDRPSGRSWSVADGAPVTSGLESADIKFFKLGTYPAGEIKSVRSGNLPSANTIKIIPLNVRVIPSSQPFEISGIIKESIDEKISFQVSGELQPFTGEEGNFTVNVKNETTGFDQNIAVQTAGVRNDDATYLELKLAAPIYNSDVITVSYSGGSIKSTDTRDLLDFANKQVVMYSAGNILAPNSWSGFEVADANIKKAYAGPGSSFWVGANGTDADPFWARTIEKANTGDASMRFSVDGIDKTYQIHTYGLGTIDKIPAGTYKVSFMVYLEEGNTMGGFWTWGGEVIPLASELWSFDGLPRGEWVKMEHVITTDALDVKKKVSIVINTGANPNASSGRQTMYLDDFSFVELEARQ
ncbi:hypothetical protein [Lutibacter citreus]|uniref:hypothetical protein n=1 Tax=Lutibacter citreus TaxID=2138210 RepID=UPI0013007C45|nr:hypothetical protein [Lutibacter citreus]